MKLKNKMVMMLVVTLASCIEAYQPPITVNTQSILVVDSFFNTNGASEVVLTRALNLSDGDTPTFVTGASVKVQDKNGNQYIFQETSSGHYTTSQNGLSFQTNYQLLITTADKKNYMSSYVTPKNSPAIDSVTWETTTDKGVQVYVNTHDPQNSTRRYLWRFDETWLYTSAYHSGFYWQSGSVYARPGTQDIYHCYQTENSTQILFSSTAALSQDVVTQFPITFIPQLSERLSNKYSILVKQIGLTEEAYSYWSQLKKNTENLGTLFAPQPALVTGNIQSTDNSSDVVLGFFSAGTATEKRIFIPSEKLFTVDFKKYQTIYADCTADTLFLRDVKSWKYSDAYTIIDIAAKGMTTLGYRYSSNACVDCRRKNGTNVKPDFWQ